MKKTNALLTVSIAIWVWDRLSPAQKETTVKVVKAIIEDPKAMSAAVDVFMAACDLKLSPAEKKKISELS